VNESINVLRVVANIAVFQCISQQYWARIMWYLAQLRTASVSMWTTCTVSHL